MGSLGSWKMRCSRAGISPSPKSTSVRWSTSDGASDRKLEPNSLISSFHSRGALHWIAHDSIGRPQTTEDFHVPGAINAIYWCQSFFIWWSWSQQRNCSISTRYVHQRRHWTRNQSTVVCAHDSAIEFFSRKVPILPRLKRPVEKSEIPGRWMVRDVVGPLAIDVS